MAVENSNLEAPDENTLEGQAHRLLAETHPQTEYREFFFGATHIGTKENMPKVYKIMQEQGLCRVEEKRVSRYPLCILHLTPQALEYMQQGSKDSVASRLEGMEYKAQFKLFDEQFTGIVDVSEIPAYNAAEIRYSIKRINITSFNEAYLFDSGKKIYDNTRITDTLSAYMQKSTKGWKLVKM